MTAARNDAWPIKNDEVVISASGTSAYAYVYRLVNHALVLEKILVHSDPLTQNFAPHSVAIDGNFILLGDYNYVALA